MHFHIPDKKTHFPVKSIEHFHTNNFILLCLFPLWCFCLCIKKVKSISPIKDAVTLTGEAHILKACFMSKQCTCWERFYCSCSCVCVKQLPVFCERLFNLQDLWEQPVEYRRWWLFYALMWSCDLWYNYSWVLAMFYGQFLSVCGHGRIKC